MLQSILLNRSVVCLGVSLPLQPLPRIRLLKVSVFISTFACFYQHFCMFLQAVFSTEKQHIKRCSSAETEVDYKFFLIPAFVPEIIFAELSICLANHEISV